MRLHWFGPALAFALLAGAENARAGEDDPSFLTLGVGYFDLNKQDNTAADFRLEYRHGEKFLFLKPWAGIEATSDGAVWGGAGVLLDIYFGRRVVVTGSIGAGGYAEGNGKDLGHAIEFRSQAEIAYRFDDRSRLGVAFSHLSNAGIADENPGVEVLNLYYSLPINRIFGD
ncbi:MAG: acyloxyacyl hydrolase [Kiloniellales bacterium]